ncbi:transcriptional regulator, TetR family [Aeromicrobium marinum DSM 15272]|uniref:Transcriptional regulator, TetR family n=1 Tax=Aeromicrobium marinum DSM 15272 TaxID=585531 RepID=E2SB88_9ACTN|nr:TetR/AcrR family transcriptional regulator [Aeromicrobium marinum]EFQ83634.1 transcriptional regulator, TetR family [Aeromicrobium marinum DSM 15272]
MARGRPRTFSDDVLLAAARSALVDHGYHEVTMDEIARRAGTSKQTLYARYEDKAGLVTECVRQDCAAMADHLRSSYREVRGRSLHTQVRAGMFAVAEFAALEPERFQLVMQVDWPEKFTTLERLQAELADEIAASFTAGFPDIDPRRAVDLSALLVSLGWRTALQADGSGADRVAELAGLATGLTMHGLAGLLTASE